MSDTMVVVKPPASATALCEAVEEPARAEQGKVPAQEMLWK